MKKSVIVSLEMMLPYLFRNNCGDLSTYLTYQRLGYLKFINLCLQQLEIN